MGERNGAWFVRTNPQRLHMRPAVGPSGYSFPPRPIAVGASEKERSDSIRKIIEEQKYRLDIYKALMYKAQLEHGIIKPDDYMRLIESLELT